MDTKALEQMYHQLKDDLLCFAYQGQFSDEMVNSIIGLSEYNFGDKKDDKKMRKKVSFLLAESFQNVVRHGVKKVKKENEFMDSPPGMFMTRSNQDGYFITSANLIERLYVTELSSKLNCVNQLTQEELKELYRKILKTGELSEKGGAGLGFIEMARKSGKELEFDFEPVDDKYSLFYLHLKVGKNDKELPPALRAARNFNAIMKSGNLLMTYRGDFSRDSILPMLEMIEDNMRETPSSTAIQKRVYITLIEMLQNISKHGYEKDGKRDGIFSLGNDNGNYHLITGNLILNEEVEKLEERIVRINETDEKEMQALKKHILRNEKVNEKGGAGLGLLEIAKENGGRLDYSIKRMNNETSLFFMSVIVC